jgi:probable F420-dependent oxidoreductase
MMELGLFLMPTDEGPDPVELARHAETRGLDSIFVGDHTHVPASRLSPFPSPPYGELPREYYRFWDPFVALAAIGTATTRVKLGTSVSLVVARDPIVMAKQVATLDYLSGGRVILGVGAGWNREEMLNHGTDPTTRMTVLRERVEAMRRIWEEELAEYHGRFVEFDPVFAWPKPVQRPLPVLVGGNGPTALDRVLAYGDGWIPGAQKDLDGLERRIAELRLRAAELGRPRPLVALIYARPERLDRYGAMGVDHCIFAIDPNAPTLAAVEEIDRIAEVTGRRHSMPESPAVGFQAADTRSGLSGKGEH